MKKLFFVLILSFECCLSYAQTTQKCSGCHGHGAITCPACGGYGQVSVYNPYNGIYYAQVCPQCSGYRKVVCGSCGGYGQVVVNNVTFQGKRTTPPNANSDRYIPHGTIKIKNTTYKYYRKEGRGYYWDGYSYVRCD